MEKSSNCGRKSLLPQRVDDLANEVEEKRFQRLRVLQRYLYHSSKKDLACKASNIVEGSAQAVFERLRTQAREYAVISETMFTVQQVEAKP